MTVESDHHVRGVPVHEPVHLDGVAAFGEMDSLALIVRAVLFAVAVHNHPRFPVLVNRAVEPEARAVFRRHADYVRPRSLDENGSIEDEPEGLPSERVPRRPGVLFECRHTPKVDLRDHGLGLGLELGGHRGREAAVEEPERDVRLLPNRVLAVFRAGVLPAPVGIVSVPAPRWSKRRLLIANLALVAVLPAESVGRAFVQLEQIHPEPIVLGGDDVGVPADRLHVHEPSIRARVGEKHRRARRRSQRDREEVHRPRGQVDRRARRTPGAPLVEVDNPVGVDPEARSPHAGQAPFIFAIPDDIRASPERKDDVPQAREECFRHSRCERSGEDSEGRDVRERDWGHLLVRRRLSVNNRVVIRDAPEGCFLVVGEKAEVPPYVVLMLLEDGRGVNRRERHLCPPRVLPSPREFFDRGPPDVVSYCVSEHVDAEVVSPG
mmetsp:Transcript_50519/g.120207  ORF Transcript_50519/g.120207 Transcript_50519/m.120207 type:complete len:436 (+) Transcript_50519:113-1420(+)